MVLQKIPCQISLAGNYITTCYFLYFLFFFLSYITIPHPVTAAMPNPINPNAQSPVPPVGLKPPTVKTAGFPHLQAGTWRGLGLHCSRRTPADISPEADGQSFRHGLVHGFAWLSSILRAQLSEMTRTRRLRLPYSQPKEWFLPPVQLTGYWEIFFCILCLQKTPGKHRIFPVLAGGLLQFTRNRSRLGMRCRPLSFRLSVHLAFLQNYQTIWCIYFCLASLK